jgi:hypothetical protein
MFISLAFGCASGRLPNAAGMNAIVKADPKAIPPDASGAQRIAAATGCKVESVRPLALGSHLFRMWPTQVAPDVGACLKKLQAMTGVEYAMPDEQMKAQ